MIDEDWSTVRIVGGSYCLRLPWRLKSNAVAKRFFDPKGIYRVKVFDDKLIVEKRSSE